MTANDVACPHPGCVAQPGEACGQYNLEDRSRTSFLIDGLPAFHAERIAFAADMSGGGKTVTDEQFAHAVENWAAENV